MKILTKLKDLKGQELLLIFLMFTAFISGKAQSFCGAIHYTSPEDIQALKASDIVQDRFGNIYDLSYFEQKLAKVQHYKSPINTGYFNLMFGDFPETIQNANHPNAGEDIRPIICQVFADLSEIIVQRSQTLACGDNIANQSVNILVGTDICGNDPNCDNASSPVAGTASPLFSFLDNFSFQDPCFPIAESLVWKKINAQEAFFPLGADGVLQINVDNISFNYQLDVDSPVASDKLDLYSIVLHEALHILGFASRIDENGEPINAQFSTTNYFSRFDQLIHITEDFVPNQQSQNVDRLMDGDCMKNCFALNQQVPSMSDLAASACGTAALDIVVGSSAIAPIYGTDNGTIGISNGMSHLREGCNGDTADFVMDPFISDGEDERTISIQELEILCQLGYQIHENSGLDCDGCYAIAQIDHTYSIGGEFEIEYLQSCCYEPLLAKSGESFVFNTDFLLCNDLSLETAQITDVYTLGLNWNNATLENIGTNNYEFYGTIPGNYRVYYTIKACDCYMSSSYFDIVLSDDLEDCDRTKCDNLVCIGDFESLEKTNDFYFQACKEDLFYMEGANQNTPDICESANNKYLDLVNIIGPEATLIELEYPILPGCTMEISVDLATRGDNDPGLLNMYGSYSKPCHPSEAFIKQDCNTDENILVENICDNDSYLPFCLLNDEEITNTFSGGLTLCPNSAVDFENYTWTVLNEFEEELHYIVLYNKTQPSVIWLDNLDIRSSCPPEVNIEVDDAEIEVGETVFMDVEVCLSDESYQGFNGADVEVMAIVPSGVEFANGGDFSNGTATILGMDENDCELIQLALQSNLVGVFEIEITVQIDDLCKEQTLQSELTVKEKTSVKELAWDEIPLDSDIYLVNVLGQAQKVEYLKQKEWYIQRYASELAPGIYFLQYRKNGTPLMNYKIMIQ